MTPQFLYFSNIMLKSHIVGVYYNHQILEILEALMLDLDQMPCTLTV